MGGGDETGQQTGLIMDPEDRDKAGRDLKAFKVSWWGSCCLCSRRETWEDG